jgi:hypothetical protein
MEIERITMHQNMIELFKHLGELSEQGLRQMEVEQPGNTKMASALIAEGKASISARVEIYPTQSVTLYLNSGDSELMLCRFEPSLARTIN